MPIQFRKTSIRSCMRTLGLAAFGLIVDAIVSHPRVDVPAMVNVAMMSRFTIAPVMASLGGLSVDDQHRFERHLLRRRR